MRPIINKWQFALNLSKDYYHMESGWRIFTFGIAKFTTIPKQGERYNKSNYKGFILKLRVWFPIEIL